VRLDYEVIDKGKLRIAFTTPFFITGTGLYLVAADRASFALVFLRIKGWMEPIT
jgi:hypothetical protein